MTRSEMFAVLEAIRLQHGGVLSPHAVLDAARADDHPFHNEFEWDDSAAAESYRLDQARQLIRRVRLVDANHPEAPRNLRAYVHLRAGGQPGAYLPAEQVAQDPVARQVILNSMRREWSALYRRYRDFEEFAALVAGDLGIELESLNNGV